MNIKGCKHVTGEGRKQEEMTRRGSKESRRVEESGKTRRGNEEDWTGDKTERGHRQFNYVFFITSSSSSFHQFNPTRTSKGQQNYLTCLQRVKSTLLSSSRTDKLWLTLNNTLNNHRSTQRKIHTATIWN